MIQRAISLYTINHFCPVTRILNSFETAMIIYLFSGGRGGVEEWEGNSFYLKASQMLFIYLAIFHVD